MCWDPRGTLQPQPLLPPHIDRDTAAPSRSCDAVWRNDYGRIVALDDCGASDGPLLHSRTRHQSGRRPLQSTTERNEPLAALPSERTRIQAQIAKRQPASRGADRGQTQVDELNGLALGHIAEGFKINALEHRTQAVRIISLA